MFLAVLKSDIQNKLWEKSLFHCNPLLELYKMYRLFCMTAIVALQPPANFYKSSQFFGNLFQCYICSSVLILVCSTLKQDYVVQFRRLMRLFPLQEALLS